MEWDAHLDLSISLKNSASFGTFAYFQIYPDISPECLNMFKKFIHRDF
jgi:hypothetical protein